MRKFLDTKSGATFFEGKQSFQAVLRTLKNIRTFVPNFIFWTKMNINEEGKYCNHNLAPVEYPTSGSLQLCQNGYNNTLFLLIKKSFYFGLRVLNDRLLNLRLIYDNLRSPQQTPLADHFPKIAVQLLIIAVPTKQVRLRTPSCLQLFQLSSIINHT